MTANHTSYDIIIIGAGMVGLLIANLLAKSSLRIAIIDQQRPSETISEHTETRVSAITLASQQLLVDAGAWSFIPHQKISPFSHMHVWTASGNGSIDFDSAEIGATTLGYILENRVLQTALFQSLKTFTNIEFYSAGLQTFELHDEEISVKLDPAPQGKNFLKAKLIIGADGQNSKVRQLANIETIKRGYGQNALICNVHTQLPHQQTAWQRFLTTGPLAFLPLADPHVSSIVWSCSPDEAEELLKLNADIFRNRLGNAFDFRLGLIEEINSRYIFPLGMQHAKSYVRPRLALIGDAAHTIHPLAGQGVNLGFQDALKLAEIIKTAKSNQQDFGMLHLLRRYERCRKSENTLMITFTEAIKQMFGANTTLNSLAAVGLNLTNKFLPLKKFFMRRATGITA